MYSVVMMAALATGGDAANCHWHCRGDGCGCYGGCYGSCYGCYGWYNGACTGSCYGCYGCQGFTYNCGGCYGCHGCYGCYGCYGSSSYYYSPGMAAPYMSAPGTPPASMPPASEVLPKPETAKPMSEAPSRARLIVELPVDAKLYIDDHLMRTTSERRTFNTPVLEKGQTYYYELRAEVVRDGKPVVVNKRVTLQAGELIQARFGEMEARESISTVKAR
jgi:uncharacterized protein (TIGR03000 family)